MLLNRAASCHQVFEPFAVVEEQAFSDHLLVVLTQSIESCSCGNQRQTGPDGGNVINPLTGGVFFHEEGVLMHCDSSSDIRGIDGSFQIAFLAETSEVMKVTGEVVA